MQLRLIFATFLAVSTAHVAWGQPGANYYVSPSGDNNNRGASPERPFKTIAKALSVASAGATIYVHGGTQNTYYEQIRPTKAGRSDAYISIVSYGGAPAYVSGATGNYEALLQFSNVHYIRISGFHFHTNHRFGAKGIHINGYSSNIHIDNCNVYNIGWQKAMDVRPTDSSKHNAHGILVRGTSAMPTSAISITNSTIRDINPGFSEGVTVTGNTENFFLSNLRVHNITNIGIDVAGHWPNEASVPINQNYARKGTILSTSPKPQPVNSREVCFCPQIGLVLST
jgi:Protein of unknown function (DUF1565)